MEDQQKNRDSKISELLEKYGIKTMKQLDDELSKRKALNISVFCSKEKSKKEE